MDLIMKIFYLNRTEDESEVHAIHGHGGKTEVIMEPDYKKAFGELKSCIDNFDLLEIVKTKVPVDGNASKLLANKPS